MRSGATACVLCLDEALSRGLNAIYRRFIEALLGTAELGATCCER